MQQYGREGADPNCPTLPGIGFRLEHAGGLHQEVVADLRSRSSRHTGMMHLLRSLVFAEARLNCSLFPVYIDTRDNYLADSLSCDNAFLFLFIVESADAHLTTASPHLLDLPLNQVAYMLWAVAAVAFSDCGSYFRHISLEQSNRFGMGCGQLANSTSLLPFTRPLRELMIFCFKCKSHGPLWVLKYVFCIFFCHPQTNLFHAS